MNFSIAFILQGWRVPVIPPTVNGVPITTYPLEPSDASALPDAQAYTGEEPTSQERKQRRRPGGRKRKRRPQSVPVPGEAQGNNNIETQTEWQPDKSGTVETDNQLAPNTQQDSIVAPTGGIFAHAEVQSQVVRVQGVNNAAGRSRIRENIQATTATESESFSARPVNKSYRRQYSVAKKEEEAAKQGEKAPSGTQSATDLKILLKQSGSLSLSEILQQQNLSLDDLLKGKQKALKALQNTAAPAHTTDELTTTPKTTRRLPPAPSRKPQTTTTAPTSKEILHEQTGLRRNLVNRISNFQRQTQPQPQAQTQPQQQTTQPAPVYESRESVEQPVITYLLPTKKTVSTIPTFTTEATSSEQSTIANSFNATGGRRMPMFRTKSIKEVVSAIRPDLTNSNSRKRMPMFMPAGNKTNSVLLHTSTQATRPAFEVSGNLRERTLPSRFNSTANSSLRLTNFGYGKNTINIATSEEAKSSAAPPLVTTIPSVITTTTVPTTSATRPTTTTVSPTVEHTRTSNRNRMIVRPGVRSKVYISTTLPPLVDTTGTENIIYITTSIPPSEEPSPISREAIDITLNERPEYDINKKLNESKPEMNAIEVEPESYPDAIPKRTVSLEDLFMTDDVPDDISESKSEDSLTLDDIIHSSTARSYHYSSSNENDLTRYPPKYSGPAFGRFRPKKPYSDVTERNPSLFTDINTRIFDDKGDLLDLLEDRRSGSRLVKVLQQRNMTLDQLVEHRKRGSSQVHLAEIFWNRTAPADTSSNESRDERLDMVAAFENFPKFSLGNLDSVEPGEIKTDSQGGNYFTSIFNVNPSNEISKVRDPPIMINLASAMASGRVNGMANSAWGSEDAAPADHNHLDRPSNKLTVHAPRRAPDSFDDVNELEGDAGRSHDMLDLELSGHGFKRQPEDGLDISLGVRSAIVASASIVCLSLGIFLVIFLICRWRQKRRKQITYSDRFQAVRGRLPILNSRGASPARRGTSPPLFLYGSRRSSKLNTMDANSPVVHDYLYEAMRKPFQWDESSTHRHNQQTTYWLNEAHKRDTKSDYNFFLALIALDYKRTEIQSCAIESTNEMIVRYCCPLRTA